MGNNRFSKGIPPSVFKYRDALVADFFNFYEMNYDAVEILQVVQANRPQQTPTARQMGQVLNAANLYWKRYIEERGLPRTLYPTLENEISKIWKGREAGM